MKAIVETQSFQKFLSVHDPYKDKSWDEVKERVTKYYQKNNENDEKFLKLCLGLAKYDLHGAPSNWEDRFEHEKTIFDWAKWIFAKTNNEAGIDSDNSEDIEEDIDYIIETYEKGLIPDCYSFMIEYFF